MTQNIVSFSGGKDSTATLLLAIERKTENLQAVFADTGNEHEQTLEYVAYINAEVHPVRTIKADFTKQIERKRAFLKGEVKDARGQLCTWPDGDRQRALDLLHPTGNPFLDLCMAKGRFPSRMAQFCSQELKGKPIYEQVIEPILGQTPRPDIWSWQGTRRDESAKRRNLEEFEPDLAVTIYRPILDWTAKDVFEYIAAKGIKPNSLYLQGMSRVGCMPCINSRKSEVLEISKRFPEHVQRIAEWEELVAKVSKRQSATFFYSGDEGVIHHSTHGIHHVVEWSKTARGGQQYDLMAFDEPAACSSQYGLCE
jgi:3'-phosphoadenosine 5'-phosphosulfate sulfotransferase (PAPS reductase)/FAD synthetase